MTAPETPEATPAASSPWRRENVTAFASGMIRSGKSQLLWDIFTRHHPRVISYDPVGDTLDRNADAVPVYSFGELRDKVKRANIGGYTNWHFVLACPPSEVPDVLAWLAPPAARFEEKTLARALGGVLFECGECDTIAPNAGIHPAVRAAAQRGRHHLLSLALATQRPALCDRTVTGQCQYVAAFMHSERSDLEYFARLVGENAADEIARLQQFEFVWYRKGDHEATKYDRDRQPVMTIPLRAER